MHSFHIANDDIISAMQDIIMKLTSALGRVAKNLRNPQYNHYLFESVAILIKNNYSIEPNFTSEFEKLLFLESDIETSFKFISSGGSE